MLIDVNPVWLVVVAAAMVAAGIGLALVVMVVCARVDRDLGTLSRQRIIEILEAFQDRGVRVFSEARDVALLEEMRDRRLVDVELHGGAAHIMGAVTVVRLRTPGLDLLKLYGRRGTVLRVMKALQLATAMWTGWLPRVRLWITGQV